MLRYKSLFWLLILGGGLSAVVSLRPVQSQEPPSQTASGADSANLEARYADTLLRLSRAKLRRAEGMNKRVANTVTKVALNELRGNVKVAEQLVASTRAGEEEARVSVFIRLGEIIVAQAESRLRQAVAAREREASAFSQADIEILQLEVEQAKLNLAMGRSALMGSAEDQLNWKVGVLYEEVIRLRGEVTNMKRRRL